MSWKKFLEENWHWPFLCLAVIISLYIRVIHPWNSVFTWTVNFGGNDPWYYYRLTENCLAHFPSRIWFDSFTYYPYGTYIHFGPFVVYLGAILAKLTGATNPEDLKSVLAIIPTIGGTLLVFPAYLLTKEVFNKRAGVMAALLIIMVPGQLLSRSILGFNDHHIWEVFWMISVLALFAYAVNLWRGMSPRENLTDRKSLLAPVLTGVAIGLFIDTWGAGFIVALMLVTYAFLVFIFKKFLNAETGNLVYIGTIAFLIAAIVYLPFSFASPTLGAGYYSPFQLLILIISALILVLFYGIELLQKNGYYRRIGVREEYVFPAIILVSVIVIILGIATLLPDYFNLLMGLVNVIKPKGGALTVAEVQPFFYMGGGGFSLAPAWFNFSITFFFAIPGILYIIYRFLFKERNDLYLFILIWGVAMFVALTGQNRFAYYFGAVSAIFAAVMLDAILNYLNFYEAVGKAVKDGLNGLEKAIDVKFVVAVFLLLLMFYPTLGDAYGRSQYAGGMNYEWYDSLTWMRNNTPGEEFYDDYYNEVYDPPQTGAYPYPEGTYGIMSWWDYGHWTTAIAHRIPNANPFQQGVTAGGNGSAFYFTSQDEEHANRILDNLGTRYVISDIEMATGKFYAMTAWANDMEGYYTQKPTKVGYQELRLPMRSEKFWSTMEAKLHFKDGDGLSHYRLVHESSGYIVSWKLVDLETGQIFPASRYYSTWDEAMDLYGQVRDPVHVGDENQYYLAYSDEYPAAYVKVFEYVEGAQIEGEAQPGENISITVEVKSRDRTFNWTQSTTADEDGSFEFIVPYSTEGPLDPVDGYTNFSATPTGPYTITAGDKSVNVSVPEYNVMNGVGEDDSPIVVSLG